MSITARTLSLIAVIVAALAVAAGTTSSAATPSLGQLNSELGAEQAHAQSLNSSIASLNRLIGSLDSQIALVQGREAAVQAQLTSERAALARVETDLNTERAHLAVLRHRLADARARLARQLVSGYESSKPDLVSVVLNANGFNQLLEQLDFLGQAEHAQQSVITATRSAKAQADAAARRLAKLQQTDRQITAATALRVRALAGMNALLQSRQAALQRARAAQQAALAASHARGAQLRRQIGKVQAAQAAAERAAQQAPTDPLGPSGGSGGWAIPYAIVLCESGGQNLPPNSAGASGYYQIIPSTWRGFGGTGPAAYETSKAEQDAVAARIWNDGAGASNWVCAGIVGIH